MIVISKLDKPKHLKHIIHKDSRGSLVEVLLRKKIKFNFNRCIAVISKRNVIKGLHFQNKFSQHKIIFILKGMINDFVVDIRKNSKNFGKVYNFKLTPGEALIIQARLYSSSSGSDPTVYFIDLVEVTAPNGATVNYPGTTSG